jgi:hypothetical protein
METSVDNIRLAVFVFGFGDSIVGFDTGPLE